MRFCLCNDFGDKAVKAALTEKAQEIAAADTLKKKTGIVYHAARIIEERVTGKHVVFSKPCRTCFPDIEAQLKESGQCEGRTLEPEIGPCGKDCTTCATPKCRTLAL